MGLSGVSNRSFEVAKEVRAFGFEEKECVEYVYLYTVGLSGVSKKSVRRMCMCHERGAGVSGELFAISKYNYNRMACSP